MGFGQNHHSTTAGGKPWGILWTNMRFQEYNISGLGPAYKIPIWGMPGFVVKIDVINLECVVFLGFEDDSPGKGGIHCVGTGFLVTYKDGGYLITAKHVAKELQDAPFLLRLNKTNGTSENYSADEVTWYYHPDSNVDVAAIPCYIGQQGKKRIYDVTYFKDEMIITDKHFKHGFIGNGDQCYTIGLFRLHSGRKRNLPVVHTGNIALLSSDEKIPVTDWDDPKGENKRFIDAHLVQSQSLEGLSGSPVLVRYTIDIPLEVPKNCVLPEGDYVRTRLPTVNLGLLGLWHGSWKAPPDELLGIGQSDRVTVPVGMGIVIPASKIIEVLEMPELVEKRKQGPSGIIAVTPDVVRSPISTDNPQHAEGFNSLVSTAAKKKPPSDRT